MLYWLFTDGRALLTPLLLPLSCAAMIAPVITVALLGAGIQRNANRGMPRWSVFVKVVCLCLLDAALTAAFVTVVGSTAIARTASRSQPAPAIPTEIAGGPAGTNPQRLLMFGAVWLLLLLVADAILWQGLRSGGWLRERIDRLRRPYALRGEMGSAHFCTMREYMRFRRPDPDGVTLLGAFWGDGHRRLDFGRGTFNLSGEDAARGILALGAPGSGKTQSVILPVIADRMGAGHSLIIADPQGELRPYVLDIARCTGHLVILHDPTSTDGPRFNLAEGIERIPEANAIARVLIPAGGGDSRFWTETATDLLSGCLIRFDNLGQIKESLSDIHRLAAVLSSKRDDAAIAASSFLGAVGTDSKIAPNTVATLGTALTGWASAQVRSSTSASDFDAALLLQQRAVIVLTCPGSVRDVYAPYLGAVLRKLMRDLDAIGEREGGPLPAPIGVVLDEFPTLGRLDGLVADVNLIRKRRISLVVAAQTKGQFHLIYGEEATKALLTGLATQIVFGGGDHDTARFYSEASGQATVDTNPDPRKALMRQRPLLTTDEIVSPADGTCHIFARFMEPTHAGQVVLKARLTRLYERSDWRQRFRQYTHSEPLMLQRGLSAPKPTPDASVADLFTVASTAEDQAVLARMQSIENQHKNGG